MYRSLAVSLGVVAYAAVAVASAKNAPGWVYASLLPLAVLLYAAHARTRPGEPRALDSAKTATRVALTATIVVAIGALASDHPDGRLAMVSGCAGAAIAGIVALSRIRAEEGLFARLAPQRRDVTAVLLLSIAWAAALVIAGGRVLWPDGVRGIAARVDTLSASIAALGSVALTLTTGALELRRRRLELGAADRLRSFVALAATLLSIAILGGALRLVHLPTLLGLCAAATGLLACCVCVTRSPETIGRLATQAAVLGAMAVAPAVALAAVAKREPAFAPLAVFAGAVGAALGGLAAPHIARALLPRTEPWTDAFEAAARAAAHPDPEPALERALLELRELSRKRLEAPSLFRFEPPSVMTVDLAGYAHVEEVTIPQALAGIAASETERVVVTDTLREAAVRRPDVRPPLHWLEDRNLSAVAVLYEGEIAIGMLGLPQGQRGLPLTLAEVRALGRLARLLAAQLAASSKLARALDRERASTNRARTGDERLGKAVADLQRERDRGEALCRILADRARVALYAPASRLAVESLERLARSGQPLAVIAPPGVDPLPYVAVFHLARERQSAALMVVDGRKDEFHDLERWRSASDSPLRQARGGTLVLVDPQLLPKLVQAYIAAAHDGEHGLAVAVPRTLDVLVARGELDEGFADAVGDRALAIPPLSARSEDLRALVIDKLTRLGLDLRGRPFGVDPSAMALLSEHDFPGNDAELESLMVRLAVSMPSDSDVVDRQDLARVGFTREHSAESNKRRTG